MIDSVLGRSPQFSIALPGGNTPRPLYRLLASTYRALMPWNRVQVFWSDERYVPPDDARSNYRVARDSLLDHVPIPRENIHPMPVLLPEVEDVAEAYEETLMSHFPGRWPRFDLVLLGLGADGHIASLFPHNPVLDERARIVAAVRAEADSPLRLTLTLPAINHAANVHFLAAGREKASAVERALSDRSDVTVTPAAGVSPIDGDVVWWLDKAAATPS
jgi:6-phosphogluconolactonase